jgi:hypothetical protein
MTVKRINMVLLIHVHMLLNSSPWAPIPANSLHNLPTLTSRNMNLALVESPGPRLC